MKLYTDHFNLEVLPFESTPDPAFFYPGPQYRETLAAMIHCVASRKSLMVVSGPIGSGKTTLGRTLTRYLSEGTQLISILHPFSAKGELLSFVAHQLGLGELTGSKLLQVEELNKRLVQLTEQGQRVLIIIDEAQLLSLEDMEEIRLLTNLETETAKLVQIILLGQSELIQHLQAPEARPLRQRLASVKILKPLERAQVLGYIRHRLKVAGGDPETFTPEALEAVARASAGIPRIINQLCDQSLLNAFAGESPRVDRSAVETVVADMTAGQSLPAHPPEETLPFPEEEVPTGPLEEKAAPEEKPRPVTEPRPRPDREEPLRPRRKAEQGPEPLDLEEALDEDAEPLFRNPEPAPEPRDVPEPERAPGTPQIQEIGPDRELPDSDLPDLEVPEPEEAPPDRESPVEEEIFSGGVQAQVQARVGDAAPDLEEDEEGVETGPIFRPAGMEPEPPERPAPSQGGLFRPGAPPIRDARPLSEVPPQAGLDLEEELLPDEHEAPSKSGAATWVPAILLLILALIALGASLWIFFNQM